MIVWDYWSRQVKFDDLVAVWAIALHAPGSRSYKDELKNTRSRNRGVVAGWCSWDRRVRDFRLSLLPYMSYTVAVVRTGA